MLKLQYLYENYALAKECLQYYDYTPQVLMESLRNFRISSNMVYPFPANFSRISYLRITPTEERSIHEVESDMRLAVWLGTQAYPVMPPCPMKDGTLCRQIDTHFGSYNISAYRKVPGCPIDQLDYETILSRRIAYNYGRLLGRFHATIQDYPTPQERPNHTAFLDHQLQRLTKYHAPDHIIQACHDLASALHKLHWSRSTYGLVHYDFEPDNIIYDRKTRKFFVIDFDDCIRCWYALDVVRALDSLPQIYHQEHLQDAKTKFIEGYLVSHDLTDEQIDTFPLMRKLINIQTYATILHALSDQDQIPQKPDWMLAIITKLTNKLATLEEDLK